MAVSFARIRAVFLKEVVQMRRDRLTFAMMMGVPLLQLVLFAFAINTDPKNLPTLVLAEEQTPFTRALVSGLEVSGYFRIVRTLASEAEAERMLLRGAVSFIVTVPAGFQRAALRGEAPRLFVVADATDPAATSGALAAIPEIAARALARELAFRGLTAPAAPVDLVLHRRFNPEGLTQYNIVPGLLGVILTMSMIMMTALTLTREVERGTLESLLALPIGPGEVMIGKILPNIGVGIVQVLIVLSLAIFGFGVPTAGSVWLLGAALLLFIAGNLTLGYTFSTLARTQMQGLQMTVFFFLPSILLSGFMFPFSGMPVWAQAIGEALPLTHMLRIVRGIMLKGSGAIDLWPAFLALAAFLVAAGAVAVARYRRTLD